MRKESPAKEQRRKENGQTKNLLNTFACLLLCGNYLFLPMFETDPLPNVALTWSSRYNCIMSKRITPLLSGFEETLPDSNDRHRVLPHDTVTSIDKIYQSTLLVSDVTAASVSDNTRLTRVEAETGVDCSTGADIASRAGCQRRLRCTTSKKRFRDYRLAVAAMVRVSQQNNATWCGAGD